METLRATFRKSLAAKDDEIATLKRQNEFQQRQQQDRHGATTNDAPDGDSGYIKDLEEVRVHLDTCVCVCVCVCVCTINVSKCHMLFRKIDSFVPSSISSSTGTKT